MADRVSDVIDDRGSDLSCGDETPNTRKTQEAFQFNDHLKSSVAAVAFQNLAPPEFVDRTPLKDAAIYAEAIS